MKISGETTLFLRIPKWTEKFSVSAGGKETTFTEEKGYAVVKVKNGDKIVVSMPMKTERIVLNGSAKI